MNGLYTVGKFVASTVSGMGVSFISGMAISAITPKDLSKGAKVLVGVGSFVIGAMAGSKAEEFVEETIDNTKDAVMNIVNLVKQNRKNQEEKEA